MTYLDTSAFIALSDRSDTHHALFRRLFAQPPADAATTTHVIAEGQAWFLRRYDSVRALQFMAMVGSMSFLKIVDTGHRELRGAAEVLRRYPDQPLTLVDALGLRLMAEHRAHSCWSTDRHLGLSGVPLVIHQY